MGNESIRKAYEDVGRDVSGKLVRKSKVEVINYRNDGSNKYNITTTTKIREEKMIGTDSERNTVELIKLRETKDQTSIRSDKYDDFNVMKSKLGRKQNETRRNNNKALRMPGNFFYGQTELHFLFPQSMIIDVVNGENARVQISYTRATRAINKNLTRCRIS